MHDPSLDWQDVEAAEPRVRSRLLSIVFNLVLLTLIASVATALWWGKALIELYTGWVP
jgi:hypothetical protein